MYLCTQNVDDLHERAGSKQVHHMHGSLFESRCVTCEEPFRDNAVYEGELPTCGDCGASVRPHIVWFGREEYGGERDILLLPCVLANLGRRNAWLWTPTTAARDRPDPWVVEVVCDVRLREVHALEDGDVVDIELTRIQ